MCDFVLTPSVAAKDYGIQGLRPYKAGAFMCRADADPTGAFRAAKNEVKLLGNTERDGALSVRRQLQRAILTQTAR